MGWWSVAAAGASAAGSAGNTWLNYGLNRSATKYSTQKSLDASKQLLWEESTVNKKDYAWQKSLDYLYDSTAYYDLARKYAENSSKWQVTGLRNAGLNPILASTDGNFSSTYGSGSSSGSIGHASGSVSAGHGFSGGDSFNLSRDLANAATAENALSSSRLSSVNADVASNTAGSTVASAAYRAQADKAQAEKLQAERDLVAANTAKLLNDIEIARAKVQNDSFGFGFNSKGKKGLSFHLGGHALKEAFDNTVNFITNSSNDRQSTASSPSPAPTSDVSSAKQESSVSSKEVRFTPHGVPYYVTPSKSKTHGSRDRRMPDIHYHDRSLIHTR